MKLLQASLRKPQQHNGEWIAILRLQQDESGWFLLYCRIDGTSVFDNWFETAEAAVRWAVRSYPEEKLEWLDCPPRPGLRSD
jgi:hypothetical protein